MCTFTCVLAALILIAFIPPIRRPIYSRPILVILKKLNLIPQISETEKQAIEAGAAWVEKEFFSGNPDLNLLRSQATPVFTKDEKDFLDRQVETLCKMIDDWKLWKTRDLPADVWDFIRKEKFLGMIIPKEHGGLGFSPYAQSEVIKKVASKSFVVAIYIMVPNSLGPGELILHYGTDEQKKNYLPKLARGEEVPCFALTEVMAGSDAGNIQSSGVIFKKGDELYIRLNWDKRYITLAKISTLMGVAFQLHDPDKLLGNNPDLGITCALVPTDHPGVSHDHRHDPLGVPFPNGPTRGKNVDIPLSAVVGGMAGVGKGWKMLMECLAAGRGIAFPAQMAGASQLALRYTAAYAQVREQFGVPIAKFEGIQRPLARLVAGTYLNEALRLYAVSALNQGVKSAVIASISKFYSTENSRRMMSDVMDILGGSAISIGPKNKVAPYYFATPISITVEGANILTRCLMIFGQGSFRAHPYAFPMIDGLQKNDLNRFDRAFFGFMWHAISNSFRSVVFSATRGWAALPFSFKKQSRYYRKIKWGSATFAMLTDLSMFALGGKLKFKESLTGRFADVVNALYLASAVLWKYEKDGEKASDWPAAKFALEQLFHDVECALQEIYVNYPHPILGPLMKCTALPFSRINPIGHSVKDVEVEKVIHVLYGPHGEELLENLTRGIFEPHDPNDHLNQIEEASRFFAKVEPLLKKRKKEGVASLSSEEKSLLEQWRTMKVSVVQVDEFTDEEYHSR